jgi:hypothetical protein
MHTITSIIEVKPYSITVTFDGKDKRKIIFDSLLTDFPILKDESVFALASLDDYPTIKWDGLARMRELDGTINPAPLDFCPDTLYEMSEAV